MGGGGRCRLVVVCGVGRFTVGGGDCLLVDGVVFGGGRCSFGDTSGLTWGYLVGLWP